MPKVNSFNEVKLTTDNNQLKNISKYWVVQFVGAPGIKFWTSMKDVEIKTNVHYICPYMYNEQYKSWMVYGSVSKLIVESFNFETGVAIVNWYGELVEFYATNFE